jgi:hypothetical protein
MVVETYVAPRTRSNLSIISPYWTPTLTCFVFGWEPPVSHRWLKRGCRLRHCVCERTRSSHTTIPCQSQNAIFLANARPLAQLSAACRQLGSHSLTSSFAKPRSPSVVLKNLIHGLGIMFPIRVARWWKNFCHSAKEHQIADTV